MPNHNPKIFTRSLLAVAVLSLSGCASSPPKMDNVDLSPIGEGILTAGRATAQVGVHAWDVSMYLLGFSDKLVREEAELAEADLDGEDFEGDEFFMDDLDDVDTAMLEDDEFMSEDSISPVDFENATADFEEVLDTNSDEEELANIEEFGVEEEFSSIEEFGDDEELASIEEFGNDAIDPILDETAEPSPIIEEELSSVAAANSEEIDLNEVEVAVSDSRAVLPSSEEYIHHVSPNETLWDIAKKTTGDATNWHVLADVNNLNQNATVFEGQRLIIPAKMLKPGFLDDAIEITEPLEVASASRDVLIDTSNIGGKNVALSASVNTPSAPAAPAAAFPAGGEAISLNAGETLWDFAKRTTGDATNWKVIAGHNNFTDKQAVLVRPGQNIVVPEALIKPEFNMAAAPTVEKKGTADQRAEVLAAIEKANKSAIDASGQLIAEASTLSNAPQLADEKQPITIVEATFKTDPAEQPITIANEVAPVPQAIPAAQTDFSQVMVSGTYYPKAIYNDANLSAPLLLRVSPGTSLKVSKAVGDWFEVETSKGRGYLHKRDIK